MKDHTEIRWTRQCQECRLIQTAKEPDATKALTNAYSNAKCRKCKSSGLDFGMFRRLNLTTGEFVKASDA